MILGLYARFMCRLIWTVRRFIPARAGALPDIPWLRRDWEWTANHECEVCGFYGKHDFIEWIEKTGPVTTAKCSHCGLEATL